MRLVGYGFMLAVAVASCSEDRDAGVGSPPPLGTGAPPDARCDTRRCSRDLRSVLLGCDGEERVIEECAAEQGCGDGRCVDACTSADLSKGSLGCSFWTVPPNEGSGGSCFAAMIANTWSRPVTLHAELGSEPLDIEAATYLADPAGGGVTYTRLVGPLPAGKVAIVFLSAKESSGYPCPDGVRPAFSGAAIRTGTNVTRAFHLIADAPVSAYSIYPYGGAKAFMPTATLLLPVSSWATDYLAVMPANVGRQDGPPIDIPIGPANRRGEARTLQIVAAEDDTEVRMQPKIPILAGGVAGATPEEPGTWRLARGQVLQFRQMGLEEASGSPVQSNKPVAVFGGSNSTFVTAAAGWADVLHQQIAPVRQWGHEYALVPYRPRFHDSSPDAREIVIYSFVGAADGTELTYDPARPRNAPSTLAAGQAVAFKSDQIVTVRSQDAAHPFHAAVYMTGAAFNGTLDDEQINVEGEGNFFEVGDPDFVNLVPSDQFLDRYVFFADYTYPETTLTIVRRKTASGFSPVELDCAGAISDFRPLGNSGDYEFAWFRMTPEDRCGQGRHEAKSDGPFSITVWGLGYCASYGYAGGTGLRPLNEVKLPIR